MDEETTTGLPLLKTERIEIEGGRYLIYYTFEQASETPTDDQDQQ